MSKSWNTKLIHPDAHAPRGYQSLTVPVYRGSTTLFPSARSVSDHWDQHAHGYTYGLYGTPTTLELAGRVVDLEGGAHTILVSGGQAALVLVNLAMLEAGDHVLIPAGLYGPHRALARSLLARLGITHTTYEPSVGGRIAEHITPNTRLIWVESPQSVTMEVQDVPSIVRAAHANGVRVALDNTWAAGVLFPAFEHGVDITAQALTKYVAGHSDVLLGSVTVRDAALYQRLGATQQLLGGNASPDDCSLALRGLQTLAVRLTAISSSALRIA